MPKKSMLSMIIVLALLMSLLTGCSNNDATPAATAPSPTATVEPTAVPTSTPTPEPTTTPEPTEEPTPTPTATPSIASDLNSTQRNSMSMLNYLAVLTKEINASSNSRMYLESAYSSLLNNTYPNAIDDRTLGQLESILDTLEDYRMIAVKRERLEFIYEQNQAQAVRKAIPNPLGLMSAVQSFSLSKLVASVVYMAVDSYTSYQSATAEATLQYLKDGWALDDQEAAVLHNRRKETFSYMVRTVKDYDLPGDLSLNENAVDDFVYWKNNDNVVRRIQFLETNQEVYQAYGGYWLLLAESYYSQHEYEKCIDSLRTYENLNSRIFRRDYGYARVIPLAIVAAGEIFDGDQYVAYAGEYVEKLLANCDSSDWALRYFAAQTDIDLYARTNDKTYLRAAYDIVLNNVNYLVDEQRNLNATYLAPIAEKETPKDATKAEKEEISNYNKMLKEERKKALPPVYEPLVINCELLFALSDERNLSAAEQAKVDGILHGNNEPLFLVDTVDSAFWKVAPQAHAIDVSAINFNFDGTKITIPAQYISGDATIVATINADTTITVTDWAVEKVERKKDAGIADFTATYVSKEIKGKIPVGAKIHFDIVLREDSSIPTLHFEYEAVTEERWAFIPDGVQYQRVK